MRLEVTRVIKSPVSLIGRMFIDGTFECWTLENAALSMPLGEFELELYHSPKFGYEVLLLKDVPNRTFIEIHIGNSAKDFVGCMGVGTTHAPDWISNSLVAFQALMRKVKPKIQSGERVTILLEEGYI